MFKVEKSSVTVSDTFSLSIESFSLTPLQHTVIVGPNGSGKSVFAQWLADQFNQSNSDESGADKALVVSVGEQQKLIEAERKKDSADILDVIPTPTSVKEILLANTPEPEKENLTQDCVLLLKSFGLLDKLDQAFRSLSTGETRKLLLIRAAMLKPPLLILDEPWDGLDLKASNQLTELLQRLAADVTLVLIANRLSEIPQYSKQLLLLHEGQIAWQVKVDDDLQHKVENLNQWFQLKSSQLALPAQDHHQRAPLLGDKKAPLVKLVKGKVAYADKVVFDNLDWTVLPLQHWQIVGDNGSGKTCLLNLISGDHPQCYSNNLNVFGYQRGSGESIWQIKQHIGYVSNSFHLEYRVNCSLLHVILSGYYDSIGLYEQPTSYQVKLAKQWLALISLEHHQDTPFQQLSFGDQRLALIARAMVKHPAMLILDEPCNGLDQINRLKVLAMVDLLIRQGNTTLLYVNHHQEDRIDSIAHLLNLNDYPYQEA